MQLSLNRVIRLYTSKRYENALKELLSLDENPAENPDISYYLGLCYTRLQEYESAILYLEQVVTTDSDILHKYQSRMILSYIYTVTGRYSLAGFELDSLLDEGYESPQVYSAYSYIAYCQNNVEESIRFLENAIALDQDNANALNSLGFILAQEGRDLDEALSYCKKAVTLAEANPSYIDSLGWVYFKIGRLEEAKTHLRKALKLASGEKEKEIAAHLKEVLAAEE